MADRYALGAEAMRQVAGVVRAESRRLRNPAGSHRRASAINESEILQGFLAENLAAATAVVDGPATAALAVWYHSEAAGSLVDSGQVILVTNRDAGFARAAGAYLVVYWLEGEWRPIPNPTGVSYLAKNSSSPISARSGSTIGYGTVEIQALSGTTIAGTGLTVTACNWSSLEVGASAFVLIHQDGFGTWWIGAEDCA